MTKQNWASTQGADLVMNFTVKTSAGLAQSIAGWSFFCTIKSDKSLADTDTGVIRIAGVIVSEANGTFTVTIPNATSEDLEGTYYYDVKYKDSSTNINFFIDGVITFKRAITQRSS